MFASSCQEDEVFNNGKEVEVTFNINHEGVASTRAISDGLTATKLIAAVLDQNGQVITVDDTKTFVDLKTTVSFRLVKGETYDFVFWAQAEGAPYELSNDYKTLIVTDKYDNVAANDEKRDAFYKVEEDITVNAQINKTITLRRPFAQINAGTTLDDFDAFTAAKYQLQQSAMTVTDVPTELDLFSGKAIESSTVDATFVHADLPNDPALLNTEGVDYKYLAMNYILAGKEMRIGDITVNLTTLNASGNPGVVIELKQPNAKYQGNYRTNILGNLLTNSAEFVIVIDPIYYEPDYNNELWDGNTKAVTPVNDVYTINEPAELAWVAQQVNSKANNFAGQTIALNADLNLSGNMWEPIGRTNAFFSGTFDGQGHTIYNMTVEKTGAAGFFGNVQPVESKYTVTIKNVTLENARVAGTLSVGVVAGSVVSANIEGCKVVNAEVLATPVLLSSGKYDDGNNAAAIVGYVSAENRTAVIKDNVVEGATVTAYRDLAAIVGKANQGVSVTGNSASDVEIIADRNVDYVEDKAVNAGAIIGSNLTGAEVDASNTHSNVTLP